MSTGAVCSLHPTEPSCLGHQADFNEQHFTRSLDWDSGAQKDIDFY